MQTGTTSTSQEGENLYTTVPKIRVTRLSSMTLRAFLGTRDAIFRHAARALRLANHRAVRGAGGVDGSSLSWTADSRIPGGTAFHLPISSGDFFRADGFAGGSGESPEEAAAAEEVRRCRPPSKFLAGMRGRGRGGVGGVPDTRQGRHGWEGLGSLGRSISPEEKSSGRRATRERTSRAGVNWGILGGENAISGLHLFNGPK
jgi:hypothetical protein